MSDFNDFGTRLKNLRKKYNLTQKELAYKVFVSPSYVSKLEKNIEHPSPKLITLLAIEFNVSTRYLVDGIEDEEFRADLWGKRKKDETELELTEDLSSFVNALRLSDNPIPSNEIMETLLEFMNIMKVCADATSVNYSINFVHVLSDYFSDFLKYLRELEENEPNQSDNEVYRISYLMSKNFQDLVDDIKEMYIERNNSSDK